ncbi:MAG TPA: hypothetical protein VNN10_04270 [Dehalococcoidia bacterium]|nr:hypothetical protein [Dehalococcoidia bacterium]
MTHFRDHRFYLVRLPDGEFRAFYDLDPYQASRLSAEPARARCRLVWHGPEDPANRSLLEGFGHPEGLFREPCQLNTFTVLGERIYGPAHADLDQYHVKADGLVEVDLTRVICGVGLEGPRRRCAAQLNR